MTPAVRHLARLQALFDAAVLLPPDERGPFVMRECQGDLELQGELESLLRCDDIHRDPIAAAIRAAAADSGLAEAPPIPEHIAGYRIVGCLGEGGMGIVYEAVQQSPRRNVALKVIRGGHFVDDIAIQLFAHEADALARLDHPHIAKIHEAGRADDGFHYFAMELVRGVPLSEWLRGRTEALSRSELRTRLRVFLQIADAVSHAHQRGVIHRDLKPSNVMVATDAGPSARRHQPDVRVLDFGLARIADGAVPNGADPAMVAGTPPYVSPERIRGRARDDVRVDVFSLGVILYELVERQLPFEVSRLSAAEAARVVCEDAPRPMRGADADLRAIVAMSLAKDPERRYASAAALLEDVHRYLADQPVAARGSSTPYQLRKMIVRHRAACAGGVAMLAVLAAFVFLLIGQLRATAAARDRADTEAASAARAEEFLAGMFEDASPQQTRSQDISARELLDRASRRLAYSFHDDPATRGRLLLALGRVFRDAGVPVRALELLGQALAIRTTLLGEGHPDVADVRVVLAEALVAAGHYPDALRAAERAESDLRAVGGLRLARAQGALANALASLARDPEAERVLLAKASTLQALGAAGDWPLCVTWSQLGDVCRRLARLDRALELFERADAGFAAAGDPEHPDLAEHLTRFAMLRLAQGQPRAAEPLLRRSLAIRERVFGHGHPGVALDLMRFGLALLDNGQADDAEPILVDALQRCEHALGPQHPAVAMIASSLTTIYLFQDRHLDARPVAERSLALLEATCSSRDPRIARVLVNLGVIHRELRDFAAAQAALDRAGQIMAQGQAANDPTHLKLALGFSYLYEARGQVPAAIEACQRAMACVDAGAVAPRATPAAVALRLSDLATKNDDQKLSLTYLRRALAAGMKVQQAVAERADRTDPDVAALLREFGWNGSDEPVGH